MEVSKQIAVLQNYQESKRFLHLKLWFRDLIWEYNGDVALLVVYANNGKTSDKTTSHRMIFAQMIIGPCSFE